jgi:hypothetical protein
MKQCDLCKKYYSSFNIGYRVPGPEVDIISPLHTPKQVCMWCIHLMLKDIDREVNDEDIIL